MFRPPVLGYTLLALAFFVSAVVEYVRGDMKQVMPLIVIGGVACVLVIWRLLKRNPQGS